jgi:DNA-binding response OmpR family regulator
MPYVDGLHLLQKIALIKNSTIRAVMTAFSSPEYMNRVIEADVHFYFKKPIDIDELLVAISSKLTKENSKDKKISLGEEFLYDYKQKNISKDNLEISLTKKEIQLLEYLINNKNSIVSIEQLENSVWQETVSADAVRMVITNLRKKTYNKLIKNIKGIGYKINNL